MRLWTDSSNSWQRPEAVSSENGYDTQEFHITRRVPWRPLPVIISIQQIWRNFHNTKSITNFSFVTRTNRNALYSLQLFQWTRITMELITCPSNTTIYDRQVIRFIVIVTQRDESAQRTWTKIGIWNTSLLMQWLPLCGSWTNDNTWCVRKKRNKMSYGVYLCAGVRLHAHE